MEAEQHIHSRQAHFSGASFSHRHLLDDLDLRFLQEPVPDSRDKRLELWREKHPRSHAKWTKEEEDVLNSLFGEGCSVSEIAKFLGRKPSAIRVRLERLAEHSDQCAPKTRANQTPLLTLEAAVCTLRLLAEGCDPVTGEVLPEGPCQHPEAIQAFLLAATLIEDSVWRGQQKDIQSPDFAEDHKRESAPNWSDKPESASGFTDCIEEKILGAIEANAGESISGGALCRLLTGSQADSVKPFHQANPYFSSCSGSRYKCILQSLKGLMANGLVLDRYPSFYLTEAGQLALSDRRPARMVQAVASHRPPHLDESDVRVSGPRGENPAVLLQQVRHNLSTRDVIIFDSCFGRQETLAEVGDRLGVSRQRISQLAMKLSKQTARRLKQHKGWPELAALVSRAQQLWGVITLEGLLDFCSAYLGTQRCAANDQALVTLLRCLEAIPKTFHHDRLHELEVLGAADFFLRSRELSGLSEHEVGRRVASAPAELAGWLAADARQIRRCLAGRTSLLKRPPALSAEVPGPADTRDILTAMANHPTNLGYTKWSAVLAGARQQNLMKAGHLDVAHYGLFAGMCHARIKNYLESLVNEGLLQRTDELYPVLLLTNKGRAYLRENPASHHTADKGFDRRRWG